MLLHPHISPLGPQPPWRAARPWSEPHPWLQPALDLLCAEGGPFAGEQATHRPRVQWQLRTGQWVIALGHGRLDAWLGYWLVSDSDWNRLVHLSQLDLIRGEPMPCITRGRHLYIADAAAAPGSDPGVLLGLARRVLAIYPEVISISGHRVRPDGSRRWHWHARSVYVNRSRRRSK
jgi:hypothetical protein